jgi:predicted nucleic acid-binding protein
MEIDVLVDTGLFINHTRQTVGHSQLYRALQQYQYSTPAISSVTKFEYELGELRAQRLAHFETNFPGFTVVGVDQAIWQRALYIQNFSMSINTRMALADLLIASSAIYLKIPLLTLNFGDFSHLQASVHRLRLPKPPSPSDQPR